jgi:thiamine biosynthesis lipoprotein
MGAAVGRLAETRFRAMGTEVHVALVGAGPDQLALAEERIRHLERRWSRFLDSSEISQLNRDPGRPVVVSADTFTLVARAVTAWHATGGWFDPTVGAALVAHGYDRAFTDVARRVSPVANAVPRPPGPAEIDLFNAIKAITLPVGVTIDPGGIGKGLAADLVAELLLASGAEGALVDIGGDLRAVGRAPGDEGWVITVDDPIRSGHELLRLAMPDGAVATSSRLLRRWPTTAGVAHHLIDPTSGRPAETDVVAVTVVAGEAWWAEVLAKALFLTGPAGLGQVADVRAVIVTADGARHATADLEATLR